MAKFIDYGLTPDTREELAEIQRGQTSFEHYFSGDWEQEHGPYGGSSMSPTRSR